MATTWLQVLPAPSINRAVTFLPCGTDMGYLKRPGSQCPPVYTPSFVPTSLRTTRDSYSPVLKLCPCGGRKHNVLLPIYLLFTNLPGVVSTLLQMTRPTQCVPGQVQDSCRAPGEVNVLTPTLNRVRRSRHLHTRCLQSSARSLAVPCSPMPVVTRVNQMPAYQVCSHPASVCLVDHVLHGICPNVMTLGSQRRAVAYYSSRE